MVDSLCRNVLTPCYCDVLVFRIDWDMSCYILISVGKAGYWGPLMLLGFSVRRSSGKSMVCDQPDQAVKVGESNFHSSIPPVGSALLCAAVSIQQLAIGHACFLMADNGQRFVRDASRPYMLKEELCNVQCPWIVLQLPMQFLMTTDQNKLLLLMSAFMGTVYRGRRARTHSVDKYAAVLYRVRWNEGGLCAFGSSYFVLLKWCRSETTGATADSGQLHNLLMHTEAGLMNKANKPKLSVWRFILIFAHSWRRIIIN